jgi:hypothetical protein
LCRRVSMNIIIVPLDAAEARKIDGQRDTRHRATPVDDGDMFAQTMAQCLKVKLAVFRSS